MKIKNKIKKALLAGFFLLILINPIYAAPDTSSFCQALRYRTHILQKQITYLQQEFTLFFTKLEFKKPQMSYTEYLNIKDEMLGASQSLNDIKEELKDLHPLLKKACRDHITAYQIYLNIKSANKEITDIKGYIEYYSSI